MDRCGAHAYAPDFAVEVRHLDGVADLDGPLEQEDDAGHEVVHDGLEPKADADAEGAREQGHPVEVHAHGPDGSEKAQQKDQIVEQARDRVRQTAAHR